MGNDNTRTNPFDLTKENIVETRDFSIRGHLLSWGNTVIQISNISAITSGPIQAPPFPVAALLMIVIGMILLLAEMPVGFIVLIVIATIWIFWWVSERQYAESHRCLNIYLNSGKRYSIIFNNHSFLEKVMQVFSNIFETGNSSEINYYIDLDRCVIDNGSAIVTTTKE